MSNLSFPTWFFKIQVQINRGLEFLTVNINQILIVVAWYDWLIWPILAVILFRVEQSIASLTLLGDQAVPSWTNFHFNFSYLFKHNLSIHTWLPHKVPIFMMIKRTLQQANKISFNNLFVLWKTKFEKSSSTNWIYNL